MKKNNFLFGIGAALVILLWCGLASAMDIFPSRAHVITPDTAEHDPAAGPRLLLGFETYGLPAAPTISQAEIVFPLTLRAFSEDSVVRFDVFLAGRSWDEAATWRQPWGVPGGDLDSTLAASFAIKCGRAETLHVDVTQMIRAWAEGSRPNLGFVILLRHPDRTAYHPLQLRPRDILDRVVLRVFTAGGE